MGWLDNQEKLEIGGDAVKELETSKIEVILPGCSEYVKVNKNQVKRCYYDAQPKLLIVVDEMAELMLKSGVKTEQGKQEDAMRSECEGIVQSLTQLGRSSGIHMICCTQRNGTNIISGTIQNNPLDINTRLEILKT